MGTVGAGVMGYASLAGATTVEDIFPVASIQPLAVGFLTRYVDLLLDYWPLFIGVAVTFAIVYMLLRKAKHAIHGRL